MTSCNGHAFGILGIIQLEKYRFFIFSTRFSFTFESDISADFQRTFREFFRRYAAHGLQSACRDVVLVRAGISSEFQKCTYGSVDFFNRPIVM